MGESRLPSEIHVLVVGSGPTGLLAANLLGTYGVETLLVERNATTSTLPKAILLDDEGLRALQAVGLAEDVEAHVIQGYGARYYAPDGRCFATVEAPVTEHGFHRRNAFLQPDLERLMARGLARHGSVTARYGTTLTGIEVHDDHVDATLAAEGGGGFHLRCDFVLACDGGRSTVRELLGIAMTGATDSRDWVVVDTINDPDGDRFSKFFCDPRRPMVSIPAPGGGRRYEFMIMPGEDPAAMAAPEQIAAVLARFRTIAAPDILRGVVYTFHARVAERLSAGRVLLLGDAAHLSPPFAGQGMNAGLRDAFNVAWKVALATKGVVAPEIVASYETERRKPIVEMIDYAVALGAIVMPTGRFDDRTMEVIAAALAGKSPQGGGVSLRPKPQSVYDDGWFRRGTEGPDRDQVGWPLPQPMVRTSDGAACRLDDVFGPGFAVVGIGGETASALARLDQPVWDRLGIRRVLVAAGDAVAAGAAHVTIVELDDDRHSRLSELAGQLLVVRPDRFVAVQCPAARPADLAARMAGLLAGEPVAAAHAEPYPFPGASHSFLRTS
jgi:3-(3-hydroxy-phenyl)propionate hydroxylase